MDIIENRYVSVKSLLNKMNKSLEKKEKKPKMVLSTLHFILPRTDEGLKIFSIITAFEFFLLKKFALVIPVLGREIDFKDVSDEIDKAINLSKMYTNTTMKKNRGGVDKLKILDPELMKELKKAVLPQ